MDAGGGPDAGLLHPGARRRQLARRADQHRVMRCSKSCRLRWTNYLRPGIKRGSFTEQEEKLIVHLQALLGNRRDHMEVISPMKDGTFIDWDIVDNIWNHAFSFYPEEHPMLIVEPSTNTGQQREKYLLTLKIMKA
ncbi:hypothetical protein OsI_26013 [Oryza sativa Indica Group]|uniref:HTH myb-type domain-containing protein n=1 Tax=Oryza sativa subsp. indica TaxID=39946 RepID=A2YLB6_ORYSI|nr:hypothetical protein OsI_26013 [Oryza sativa Indica Group]